ncbi:MAG: hypothetical protein NWQ55_01600 [Salibacteraceae bacterium]|nr:hypothetical protein [Salibacteraceae bacterium]
MKSLSTNQSYQHNYHADQKHENADAIDAMHHFQIDVVAFAFAKHGHRVQVS